MNRTNTQEICVSLHYREKRIGPLQTPPPHSGPGCEGLFLYIEELKLKELRRGEA
jgi:hypothetical protein